MSQQETDDELEQIQRARDKDDELNQRAAYYVVDIKDLFGPPPVLTTENPQAFDRILLDLVRSRWPQDFIQKMLVWDIANQVWLDMRYDRHTRYTLERGAQSDFQSLPPRLQGSDNKTQIASRLARCGQGPSRGQLACRRSRSPARTGSRHRKRPRRCRRAQLDS